MQSEPVTAACLALLLQVRAVHPLRPELHAVQPQAVRRLQVSLRLQETQGEWWRGASCCWQCWSYKHGICRCLPAPLLQGALRPQRQDLPAVLQDCKLCEVRCRQPRVLPHVRPWLPARGAVWRRLGLRQEVDWPRPWLILMRRHPTVDAGALLAALASSHPLSHLLLPHPSGPSCVVIVCFAIVSWVHFAVLRVLWLPTCAGARTVCQPTATPPPGLGCFNVPILGSIRFRGVGHPGL